ncbi:stressosome-associated protein Prli42 [Jeotgalibacillus soli]|nr:stressosome-associated protein Prli42 [Jeotgalibacillus soli]
MRNRKFRTFIVYLMIFAMLASSLAVGFAMLM